MRTWGGDTASSSPSRRMPSSSTPSCSSPRACTSQRSVAPGRECSGAARGGEGRGGVGVGARWRMAENASAMCQESGGDRKRQGDEAAGRAQANDATALAYARVEASNLKGEGMGGRKAGRGPSRACSAFRRRACMHGAAARGRCAGRTVPTANSQPPNRPNHRASLPTDDSPGAGRTLRLTLVSASAARRSPMARPVSALPARPADGRGARGKGGGGAAQADDIEGRGSCPRQAAATSRPPRMRCAYTALRS